MDEVNAALRADGFITPSIGADFCGNAGDTLRDAAESGSKPNVGAAVGWMSVAGVLFDSRLTT